MSAIERESFPAAPEQALWAVPTLDLPPAHLSWRRHVKRGLDLVVVVALVPVAIPLMLVIAALIKWKSPGPVLFRQERVGRQGELFGMLKFRTMYVDATERLCADPELHAAYVANDYKLPADQDPRIAPFGRFLRRTSLDELPQLFNVLRGDMSLVGPRPIVPGELVCYGNLAGWYLSVRPGLTGRWQCNGRSTVRYPERAELDAEYVATWSLRQDARILLKTIPSVLRRHGAH
jgi:lipopolysaccharide/colanic/teichoic acid biosynthesis glycosyltransferase